MPKPTVGSITQLTTDPAAPLPRYTPVLVADPTMPLPHAAPAPAADAATGERVTPSKTMMSAWARGTFADHADKSDDYVRLRLGIDRIFDALAAAEAELAGLRADVAAWVAKATRIEIERADVVARAEAAEAERDRLSAELAALRGVMPDPAELEAGADLYMRAWRLDLRDMEIRHAADRMRELAAAIAATMGEVIEDDPAALRAALATATPTPPAAEAVTGGWTREAPTEPGEYWAIVDRWSEPAPQMVSLEIAESGDTWWASDSYDDTYGYSPRQILLWGPIAVTPTPPGWREALAALDQPQEADHAAQ